VSVGSEAPPQTRNPIMLSKTPLTRYAAPPQLGEHNRDVRRWLTEETDESSRHPPDHSSPANESGSNLNVQLVRVEDPRQPVAEGLVHIDHEVVVDVVPGLDDLQLRFHLG
jgi:hypothetical protein